MMPTLSEINEHAADAEHQAFQRAYDALLNVAKDPITCRHFWDAGFTAGQADANDMLTIAHMDGYSKGREAMRAERARHWPTEPEIMALGDECQHFLVCDADGYVALVNDVIAKFARPIPPPDVRELVEAADAVVHRWDSPLWSQQGHTGEFIARLRAALARHRGQS